MPNPSPPQIVKFTGIFMVLLLASIFSGAAASTTAPHALVRGADREIDETVGALIRSKSDTTRFLFFSQALADSIGRTARARFLGSTALADLRITGDSGDVRWATGRRYSHPSSPGVLVRIRGRAHVPGSSVASRDTLSVVLPGLLAKAASIDETPLSGDMWMNVGDSTTLPFYAIYDTSAAAGRAAQLLWALCGLCCALTVATLWIGVRSVLRRAV